MKLTTAGESHGRGILAVIEGMPAGVKIDFEEIARELERRRKGYGRGERMALEKDEFEVISGIINKETIGSPISILIRNTEWEKWSEALYENPAPDKMLLPVIPRPGHADYAGVMKYAFSNIRPVIERSSARTTAALVAAGSIFKAFLKDLKIEIKSVVTGIGGKKVKLPQTIQLDDFKEYEKNEFRTVSREDSLRFKEEVDRAKEKGTTVGGVVEVWAFGVPPGIGSYMSPFERIDAMIAASMMAIPSVKAVEIGEGIEISKKTGAQVLDEFDVSKGRIWRKTNYSGGIEGGMTNGEPVRVRLYIKPVPTQRAPLNSVDLESKKKAKAFYERSDICVVPTVGVIGESMIAYVLAKAILEKFGKDSMGEILNGWKEYLRRIPWSPRRELHL